MKDIIRKNFIIEKTASDYVIVSSDTEDLDGDIVMQDGWDLTLFKKNPVMFYMHMYYELPIGKWEDVKVENGKLIARPVFSASDNEQIKTIRELWDEGIIKGSSVSFRPVEVEDKKEGRGRIYKKQVLLEISITPIPAQYDTIKMAKLDALMKTAIPYKKYDTAPEEEDWDANEEVKKADVDDLKIMCAWYDEENPDVKQSYKLPHHKQADKKVVWKGVVAAMAALMGARGGVDIPDKDWDAVYNHIAKHYKDFDKEPPEKSFVKSIYDNTIEIKNILSSLQSDIKAIISEMKERLADDTEKIIIN